MHGPAALDYRPKGQVFALRFPILLLAPAFAGGLCLGAPFQAAFAADSHPVLVELFLSQSCKASPPAAELATQLSTRDDVVALAYHVGYWDMLAGREGEAWRDPFSKPVFADRHRAYNKRLRGKNRGMTPQAVIDGAMAVSAAKTEDVTRLIHDAEFNAHGERPKISFAKQESSLDIVVEEGVGEVMLVRFLKEAVTDIEGGDNDGLVFREANVVTDVATLGSLTRQSAKFKAVVPEDGAGCAVIVQEPGQGAVIAAQYCP